MIKKTGNLRWLWVSLLVFLLDACSKAYIKKMFFLGMSYSVLPVLNITMAYNHGAAFSFLNQEGGWQQWMFGLIAIAVIVGLLAWLANMPAKKNFQAVAICLIIGGALGNLFSRLYYGYVVDFIDFHLGHLHWPAFNIADAAICVGVFMLFIDAFGKK